jgi:hypothetical protein
VGGVALSLALQLLVVHVPLLNRAFGTTPLSIGDWALCAAMASSVLWADELTKLIVGKWCRGAEVGPRPHRAPWLATSAMAAIIAS